eukprot:14114106-Heterocapsa_arctica.AAC.1
MRSDRNFRISATRAYDPDHPLERPGFEFFKRCDIRDTASYFLRMGYESGGQRLHHGRSTRHI